MPPPGAAAALRAEIHRSGPITFAAFQGAALDAYFASGGGAGRAGRDFITSPEVGTLFGALVARALDATWARLGAPDPFLLVDAGGGRGRLLADVLRAAPACAPALRAVLVERSPQLRAEAQNLLRLETPADALGPFTRQHEDEPVAPVPATGPVVTSLEELPDVALPGVIVANELLDNLPVRLVERASEGWLEVLVGADGPGFVEVLVDAPLALSAAADEVADGAQVARGDRLPVPLDAAAWLARAALTLPRGQVWVIDYADETAALLARGPSGAGGWLRTYRAHRAGGSPLDDPGTQDITCDVPLPWLRRAATAAGFHVASETTQAAWLAELGVDALADEGRRTWLAGAARADLTAIAGRSMAVEAAALTDPTGLGAHRVVVLDRPATPRR
ncbi:MAG TPA: class I SAM-dependent methyltransferase [Acidimicrobiia bacterium]|nr:class I SAM-dependent methyltransferase [Acidimicrobiia bacterium]